DANQAGDSNYTAAPQDQQSFTVGKGSQTISFTSTPPSSPTVGGTPYTPTATGGNSGNPVTFTIDPASTSGACTIAAGVVSFTGNGTCVIDANQAGDSNYTAAPQDQQSFTVGKGSQTISFTSTPPGNATVGGATYHATATGGDSTQSVVLTIDSTSTSVCAIDSGIVSFTGVGTCLIDANQAGDSNYDAAPQRQQSFTVGKGSQSIEFTSTVPGSPTVGGPTYAPTATGGNSGNPVTFTIDPASTSGACTIAAGVVSFTSSGNCVIDANQAGDSNYTAAAQAQQAIAIQVLHSDTTLSVSGSTLTASVTGAGPIPTGSVTFDVNGTAVGTAPLGSGGSATLQHAFAAGQTYTLLAQYAGDGAYARSSATLTYKVPAVAPRPPRAPLRIALKLSSRRPESHGWWTAPVTVRFVCTRNRRPATPCPRPIRLARSGRGQLVRGHRINIDLGKPSVGFGGINAGATYLGSAPKPSCVARDRVSGITRCSISRRAQSGAAGVLAVTFSAKAVSGAGIAATSSVTVTEQQPGLIGRLSSALGIYAVNRGSTYTLQVASRIKPQYLEGAIAPQLPAGAHNWFSLTGHHHGVPLWELSIVLPSGLPANAYWNVGIQIGNRVRVVAIRD
ncbi:MAG: Ig-like domain repeat protein, partial [Acidobacteriota bacterium]|nr:Ig-like domain repeat protein [Acidobacteriota bacterium]